MAKVICTLPNASTSINGVAFVSAKGAMISEEISDEKAAHFASIKGYTLADRKGKPVEQPADPNAGEQGAAGGDPATQTGAAPETK